MAIVNVIGSETRAGSESVKEMTAVPAMATGAQMVALGTRTPGVMGTDDFRDRVAARSAEASRALSEAASARVSFSATTTDHLGFLGRTEGLLAVATALVYPVPDAVRPVVG